MMKLMLAHVLPVGVGMILLAVGLWQSIYFYVVAAIVIFIAYVITCLSGIIDKTKSRANTTKFGIDTSSPGVESFDANVIAFAEKGWVKVHVEKSFDSPPTPKQKALAALSLGIALAEDYDGFTSADDLKSLIKDMVQIIGYAYEEVEKIKEGAKT